jgi:YidC/Oxa1 family membrane protein insertase
MRDFKGQVSNPQRIGSTGTTVFLILFVAMIFLWFGLQHSTAIADASHQAAPVVQSVSVKATTDGFGRWGIVARPMLFLLNWVHLHVVGNWGWAIAILTALINLALWPMRVMSLRSTLRMQRIQPKMEAIKSRYEGLSFTDPKRQKMQQEVAELQKSEGVNMLGGCLPALIPWPMLVGFYKMLAGAVALRGASWLWVQDLAAVDVHHVLPVLVVLTMAASQMLTPAPGIDPKQQRVMALVMPIVFGMFAWKYAAGLALYFVCSNVFGVLQQMVMNRTATGKELRRLKGASAVKA